MASDGTANADKAVPAYGFQSILALSHYTALVGFGHPLLPLRGLNPSQFPFGVSSFLVKFP